MADETDHVTGLTGLTEVTVQRRLNGYSLDNALGSVSEVGYGVYAFTPVGQDVAYVGPAIYIASATGADNCIVEIQIVSFDPYSATNLGLSNLDAAVSTRSAFNSASDTVTVGNTADCKADVSTLSTFDHTSNTVNLSSATEAQIDAIEDDTDELQTNQSNWLTATGFSTHSAADVASAVWGATTRTLSGFGTLVSDIWNAATRSLTDKAGFTIAGTKNTLDDLNDISTANVKTQADTALTDYDPPTRTELDDAVTELKGSDEDTHKTLSDQIDGIASSTPVNVTHESTAITRY